LKDVGNVGEFIFYYGMMGMLWLKWWK